MQNYCLHKTSRVLIYLFKLGVEFEEEIRTVNKYSHLHSRLAEKLFLTIYKQINMINWIWTAYFCVVKKVKISLTG